MKNLTEKDYLIRLNFQKALRGLGKVSVTERNRVLKVITKTINSEKGKL